MEISSQAAILAEGSTTIPKGSTAKWPEVRDTMNTKPVQERFASKTKPSEGGCLEWTGSLSKNGYGMMHHGGKTVYAHRVAWEIKSGPIPVGRFILHTCDNRKCVNVAHLWVGTFDDNMADMVKKQRQAWGLRSSHAKLTDAEIVVIRSSSELQADLSDRFGVSQGHISMIRSHKTRKIIAEDIV